MFLQNCMLADNSYLLRPQIWPFCHQHFVFLNGEVTIFGREGEAGVDILIGTY